MKKRIQVIIVLAMVLTIPVPTIASVCQDLAKQFATGEASMGDRELAALRSCVDKALRNRIFGTGSVAAPAPPPYEPPSMMDEVLTPEKEEVPKGTFTTSTMMDEVLAPEKEEVPKVPSPPPPPPTFF